MNKQNLLLIDNRILDLHDIINSLDTNVKYIIVDYENDTFTNLIDKIQKLNISLISSVGLVRHAYFLSTYKLINKQTEFSIVKNIELLDPLLNSWNEIKTFILNLKNNYNIEYFDFISCRLDKYSDYQYIFNNLEKELEINIGASTDDIGNVQYGGNWILESDNVNLIGTYFNSNILNYPYIFFTPVLEIKGNSFTKFYDGIYFTNPQVTYDGFIDGDTYLSLSGTLLFTGDYQNALLAGSYNIIPYGYVSYKYYLNYINGILNISPAILNISINNYIKI